MPENPLLLADLLSKPPKYPLFLDFLALFLLLIQELGILNLLHLYRIILLSFSSVERDSIFFKNAEKIYKI